jgi:hypothetical protein
MSDFNTKKCDNCGKIKADSNTNGWWTIRLLAVPFALIIHHLGNAVMTIGDMREDYQYTSFDCCGETCLFSKISSILGSKPMAGE